MGLFHQTPTQDQAALQALERRVQALEHQLTSQASLLAAQADQARILNVQVLYLSRRLTEEQDGISIDVPEMEALFDLEMDPRAASPTRRRRPTKGKTAATAAA